MKTSEESFTYVGFIQNLRIYTGRNAWMEDESEHDTSGSCYNSFPMVLRTTPNINLKDQPDIERTYIERKKKKEI